MSEDLLDENKHQKSSLGVIDIYAGKLAQTDKGTTSCYCYPEDYIHQ